MKKSIADADFLTLQQACKLLPKHPHVNTLKRWCSKGVGGVVLESWKCGHSRMTSVDALDDFIEASSGGDRGNRAAQSPSQQEAEAALDRMGVK